MYYRSQVFAVNTKKSYKSFQSSYCKFCIHMGYKPVPISSVNLCRYVAHIAQRLSVNSIPRYLSVIKLLHLELGYQDPLKDNWLLQSLLKGIKRHKGSATHQKLPITPFILSQIYTQLNFISPSDVVFWGICLTMFFGFFRKANVLPQSFDPSIHLRRMDFKLFGWGLLVKVRHSKTIQFQDRILEVPLVKIPNSTLCPVKALLHVFLLTHNSPSMGPVFTLPQKGFFVPFQPRHFVSKLKTILQSLGYPSNSYSGHSFRRGAATWALSVGVPSDLIQLLGDWKSESYKSYLGLNINQKVGLVKQYYSHKNLLL